ncbi:hypothetical protein [Nostoc sp. TCL26-01]|uniref:hypothetical protein n=1 Tax=Nostoc sp. TCL26-01 TaxID=2576904 RepID=UPI0015BA3D38|nr:hypothetical protein [Nostoc sp. TCL26-01]QLE54457.1 hypothetical protein FD725_02370 [Nostoc sp. TCL26-01]
MRKLTNSDKQEILKLYRETAETTSTLAERYDVSNSTISRLLKSTLAEDEYEYLVSLKRAARTPEGRAQVSYDQVPFLSQPEPEVAIPSRGKVELPQLIAQPEVLPEDKKPTPAIKKARQVAKPTSLPEEEEQPTPLIKKARRVIKPTSLPEEAEQPTPLIKKARQVPKPTSLPEEEEQPTPVIKKARRVIKPTSLPEEVEQPTSEIRKVRRRSLTEDEANEPIARQLEIPVVKSPKISSIPDPLLEDQNSQVNAIAQMLGEDLLDESDDLDDLDDDLDEDLDEEDYEDDDEDLEEARPLVTRRRFGDVSVQVLPLSVASLPKTCYLVIDRSSELITRPLKDFGDLGQIPSIETQQRTLPVFDNHRVAKRFSTKRDRVIKVPDSKMLHKARTHLQAKGITRLLIDGQVYSLSMV